MSQVLYKRTYDSRIYDIVCTNLLSAGEAITAVTSVSDDQTSLTYGSPVVNTTAISFPTGLVAAIGSVIQVQISGGAIKAGSDSMSLGIPNMACIVRAKFTTSLSNHIDATLIIVLQDIITP